MADLDARVSVLESRMDGFASDGESHEKRIETLRAEMASLETRFEVLKERVAMYAALGAVVGSVAINFVTDAVQSYLHVK